MRNYIYLIVTFILLFCLGCGSVESMDANGSPKDPCPNESDMQQDSTVTNGAFDSQDPSSEQEDCSSGNDSNDEADGNMEDCETEENKTGNTETEENKENNNNRDNNYIIEEMEYVAVHTEHIYEEYVDRETGISLVDMNYQIISLEEGNEALEQTISKWMVKRRQDLEEKGLELMVKAKNKQKETGNENLTASLWHEITLYRADNRLISFVDRQYSYAIDTWNNDYRCVNFDVESGKSILLDDLLVDKEGFKKAVTAYCVETLENSYTNSEIDDNFVEDIYQHIATIGNWCLDASGFVFVYEDDEMKYSNEGVLFVHVPYDKVLEYMNPKYLWGDTYGIAALGCDQTAVIQVDGVENKIRVEKQYDEYYIENLQLIYGDTVLDMGKHMRTDDIYLLSHPDWKYLVWDADMASEDYETYCYQLKKDGIGQCVYIVGDLDAANIRADGFHLEQKVDVLGTYHTQSEYFILEDGGVASYRSEYEIEHVNYDYCTLVTVRELPVVKDSKKITLPVGTKMRICSTDNASWAKFVLLDSMEEVIVHFERKEDYIIRIAGISEYEYFEDLPYAG